MQKTAINLVKKLQKAGHTCYFAGGCVRDLLLKKEPNDYDIVTDATPERIENLLEKTIPLGKKFGVITVVEDEHHFEVATFRSDSGYTDGRRPNAVLYTDPKEDALRRDFTINGMFFDPIKEEVIDFVGGQKDLENNILRFIGDPQRRIREDKLRILRAVRFKHRFDLNYHKATKEALKEFAYSIITVSHERIRDELNKMFLHWKRHETLSDLIDLGILEHILPEITNLEGVPQPKKYHHDCDALEHTIKAFQYVPNEASLEFTWAALLHDTGKAEACKKGEDGRIHCNGHAEISGDDADTILRRLKFSTAQRKKIVWLIKHHMSLGNIEKMSTANRRKLFLEEHIEDLIHLLYVDEMGGDQDLILYEQIHQLYKQEKETILLPGLKPLLNGRDIMTHLKLKPGPKIQDLLSLAFDAQLEEKVKTKQDALDYLARFV